MKLRLFILLGSLFFFSSTVFCQTVHGPSAKIGYSTLDQFSFGAGYHFMTFKDDWGWSRPSHNYYVEYLPEFNAFGASANVQYALIFVKAGFEASFRSKNENDVSYFAFFPNAGIEMINIDLSVGPEFVTTPVDDKSMGFKVLLKVQPKLFNKGAKKFKLKRTE